MDPHALDVLIGLNAEERSLEDIQEQIDKARRKYFDVGEIQLHLDRRQAALDEKKKRIANAKGYVISPN
jgi:ribosome maturation protein Sdo1